MGLEVILAAIIVLLTVLLVAFVVLLVVLLVKRRKSRRKTPAPPLPPLPIPSPQPMAAPPQASIGSGNQRPPPGVAYLTPVMATSEVSYIPLTKPTMTMGRDPACDIPVDERNATISRRHAQVIADGNGYILVDLDSGNGVFVDGVRIGRNRLRDGVVFSLGQVLAYTFHLNSVGGAK